MHRGIIGKKLGMTSYFLSDGKHVPVTVLQLGPCVVTQIKTVATDGYNALQLGFGKINKAKPNKPLTGHLSKSGSDRFDFIREVNVENPDEYKIGQELTLDLFKIGDFVDITGLIKGRGFSGVVKRHGFHGGKATHGCTSHKVPGSIGCSAWPSKVIKGKKMPGQYGNTTKTIRNLEIVDVRQDENLILIKGAVPGCKSGLVHVNKPKYSQSKI